MSDDRKLIHLEVIKTLNRISEGLRIEKDAAKHGSDKREIYGVLMRLLDDEITVIAKEYGCD